MSLAARIHKLGPEELDRLEAQLAPLSSMQKRLWFLAQLESPGPAYHIWAGHRLRGRLDVSALSRALGKIERRHEALRTVVVTIRDRPYQAVLPATPRLLAAEDLSHLPGEERERALREIAMQEYRQPFDLGAGPLVRYRLLALGEEDHALLITVHHLIADGWSLGIFFRELRELYAAFLAGRPSLLPAPGLQSGDFARWQLRQATPERIEADLTYWREHLKDAPGLLALPCDRPRPAVPGGLGRRIAFRWPPELWLDLAELARRRGATLFMVLLAGFTTLLHRWSGETDLVVGTGHANREHAALEEVFGFLVQTTALRTDLSGDPTSRELLERVRAVVLGGLSHQAVDFDRVVAVAGGERGLDHSPLFQVVLELHDGLGPSCELVGLAAEPLELDSCAAKFDLSFHLESRSPESSGTVELAVDLFDEATVRRMIDGFRRLLESMVLRPEARIGDLPLLAPEERAQLVAGRAELPWDGEGATFVSRFEEQVGRTPDAAAVIAPGGAPPSLTYRELDAWANGIAAALATAGIEPGSPVGLRAGRSAGAVAGLLGIFKAGAVYVPIDPALPTARRELLARSAGLKALVTDADGEPGASGPAPLRLRTADARPVAARPPGRSCRPEAPAYAIYTSGSTGEPNAVLIRHESLLRFRDGMRRVVAAQAAARPLRAAMNAPLHFDASFQQLLLLLDGHSLCIVPEEVRRDAEAMVRFLAEQRIDLLDCTPTHADMLAGAGLLDASPWPSVVLMGGEAVPPALWDLFRRSGRQVFNVYGPTEATVNVTVAPILPEIVAPTIGRPLAHVDLHVLEPSLEPAPAGVPGEIYLGGPQLAAGYLGQPARTAERFVPDPFSPRPGERLYRTGDRARRRADGSFEFLGRRDGQVKLRGHRIELGEIEAALRSLPGLRDGVAAMVDGDGGPRIVAWATRSNGARPEPLEIQSALRERLPAAMVPSTLEILDRPPLTPSGKLDRRALLRNAPPAGVTDPEPEALPPLAARLAEIWCSLLGLPAVRPDDSFFAVGGHSFLAVQLMRRIQRELDVRLSVGVLFKDPTLAGFTRAVERELAQTSRGPSSVVTLQGGRGGTALICLHPIGGEILTYRHLLQALGPGVPVFGVQSRALDDPASEHRNPGAMVASYAAEIAAAWPDGPCALLGWSLGGLLAMGVAHELEAAGREVAFVELWDCGLSSAAATAEEDGLLLALRATFGAEMGRLLEEAGELDPAPWLARIGHLPPRARFAWIVDWARERGLPAEASPEILERQVALANHHTRLFSDWWPSPVHSPLHVRWARHSLEHNRVVPTDWGQYTSGPVETRIIEGTHFSMARSPGVLETAAGLADRLLCGRGHG